MVDAIVDYVPATDRHGTGQLEPQSWHFTFDSRQVDVLANGARLRRLDSRDYVIRDHRRGAGMVTYLCTRTGLDQ